MKYRALALVVLAACSDAPVSESAEDLSAELCSFYFRCCDRTELDFFLAPFVLDEQDCIARFKASANLTTNSPLSFLVPNLRVLAHAVEEGRIEIDEKQVAACAEFIRASECNVEEPDEPEPEDCVPPDEPEPTPCDPGLLIIGKVGAGGACTNPGTSIECARNMTCLGISSLGDEGVCIEPGDVGAPCFQDAECHRDLTCYLSDGTCQVPRSEGEPCLYGDDGATIVIACDHGRDRAGRTARNPLYCDPVNSLCVQECALGRPCSSDLQCSANAGLSCVAGRCDTLRTEGQPCGEDVDCADDFRCAPNSDPFSSEDVCQPKLAVGAACAFEDGDCTTGFCDASLASGGLCADTVAPPGLCPSHDDDQCNDGYCDAAETTTPCSSSAQCASNSCNSDGFCDALCVSLKADGTACLGGRECRSQTCLNGFCRAVPLADGEECSDGSQCEPESFCNFGESPATCRSLPLQNGVGCSSPAQCASEVCFDGSCQQGLSEGADCTSAGFTDPPCGKDLYCEDDVVPNVCVPVLPVGARCESSEQCSGACATTPFGRLVCHPGVDDALCVGAET